jgi:hypothetical protein
VGVGPQASPSPNPSHQGRGTVVRPIQQGNNPSKRVLPRAKRGLGVLGRKVLAGKETNP